MIKNYFLVAFRFMSRQKGYAFINFAGLTVGIASGLLVLLFVIHELSYDRFYEGSKRIYRVTLMGDASGTRIDAAVASAPVAPNLKREYAEVEAATVLHHPLDEVAFKHRQNVFFEKHVLFANHDFLKVFGLDLLRGNAEEALRDPYSVVLTEKAALKLFNSRDVVGELIEVDGEHDFRVTGLMENLPENTHIRFDYLCSFSTYREWYPKTIEDWGNFAYHNYLRLKPGTAPDAFNQKLDGFLTRHMGDRLEKAGFDVNFQLQPVTDIHLHSHLRMELSANSDIRYVYLFSGIAFLILVIAAINYMNLATARSTNRAIEVAMRKVTGAKRRQLIGQFFLESVLFCLMSLVFALLLIELILPWFNTVSGKSITIAYLFKPLHLLIILGITLFVGLAGGSYPALYLARLDPVRVLKSKYAGRGGNTLVRNILVTVQFIISVALMISTIMIYKQMHYVSSKRLGFTREERMVVKLRSEAQQQNVSLLKTQINDMPALDAVTVCSNYPGNPLDGNGYLPEGREEPLLVNTITTDAGFMKTMEIEVLQGRGFKRNHPADTLHILMNQKLVEDLGWKEPIGKRMKPGGSGGRTYRVAGVIANFHFFSLHEPISPLILRYTHKPNLPYMIVSFSGADTRNAVKQLRGVWENLFGNAPLSYTFLDAHFQSLYENEQRLSQLFLYFTFFAFFIASIGLFGLASYASEMRKKEIGVRKVFGAERGSILRLFSYRFMQLLIIANLIAYPLAWYSIGRWLENFAFATNWSVWIFAGATLISLLIALISVSFQGLRMSAINPANILRDE